MALKYIKDGEKYSVGVIIGGAGHTIENAEGTALAQRDNLQFADSHVSDDSTNNATVVEVLKETNDFDSETEDGLYLMAGSSVPVGDIEDDYISVTTDGDKTYAALLNEIYSDMDSTKISEFSVLQMGEYVFQAKRFITNSAYMFVNETVAGGTGNITYRRINLMSSASSYILNDEGTYSDQSNTKPTSGIAITLYYGTKSSVINLKTSAEDCMMSDGRSVQDLTNSDFGTAVNVKTYTSSDYVAPSDGYLSVLAEIVSGGFAELQINGVPYRIIATSDYSGKDMIFIRKGMKIRFSSVNPSTALSSVTANFYPLV